MKTINNYSRPRLSWASKLLSFLILCGLGQEMYAQMVSPAHVPQSLVQATAGTPSNFSCRSPNGEPLSLCIWEKFNSDKSKPSTLISFTKGSVTNSTSLPGYYLDGDLGKGVCGLLVENVTRTDMSKWQCTLFASSNVYRAVVDINVQKKPQPPRFIPDNLGNLVDGQLIGSNGNALTCFSAQGLPPPTFQWYLGDDAYEGELFPVNTTEDDEGNTYTFQQLKNQFFTWRENGKKLRCAIVHHMITEDDVREATIDIQIKYKPRADQNSANIYVPELGLATTLLPFKFYANPKPRIYWEVDGDRISAGFASPDRRTEALVLEEVGPSNWLAQLRVKDMVAKDLRKKYVLKTENDVGRQDFSVCITQNPSREGASCLSEGLFLKVRPNSQQQPQQQQQPLEDDDTRSELSGPRPRPMDNPMTAIFEKLKDVQQQMQVLLEQEARLQVQLSRVKGPKSIEDDSETKDDEATTIVPKSASGSGEAINEKQRDGRLLRFNSSQANNKNNRPRRPIQSRPFAPPTGGFDDVAEVKVESAGIHIRKKSSP